jgi:hypothetical protein
MALSTPRDFAPLIRLIGGVRKDFGWVLFAMAGSQMRDSLDTNVQGFELLPNDFFRHNNVQDLYQKAHTTVLREREHVKTHTLLPIEGPQCADRGSEHDV